MRIKVYLFSTDAKARAQSFSVFVLSIFTNGSKGPMERSDGVKLYATKYNLNNTAPYIGTIAG
jgi:hypothetical protein